MNRSRCVTCAVHALRASEPGRVAPVAGQPRYTGNDDASAHLMAIVVCDAHCGVLHRCGTQGGYADADIHRHHG